MPTYQYRCAKCHRELEVFQKFTDEPLRVCPDCAGELHKVFSPVGIVFKGSGFYSTDNHTHNGAAVSGHAESHDGGTGASSGDAAASGSGSGSGSGSDAGAAKAGESKSAAGAGAPDGAKQRTGSSAAASNKTPAAAGADK